MNRFLPIVFLFLFSLCLTGQPVTQINSGNGYVVNISLVATGIQVNQPCPNGYNYDVVFDYDITFTGSNIPANGLWTLQANVGCGNNNLFLPLPSGGGSGVVTTTGNSYQADCGVEPTIEALVCDQLVLTIQGPGISRQNIDLSFVLPVNFTAFTANLRGKQVQLDWRTSAETDNDYFEVQRSSNAVAWNTIGRVSGNGSVETGTEYAFLDLAPRNTETYYRLRQVDFDGTFTFSPIVRVSLAEGDFTAFPNPTSGPLTVSGGGDVIITDLSGRTLLSQPGLDGNSTTTLDLSTLRPGLYLVQSSNGVQKVLKK